MTGSQLHISTFEERSCEASVWVSCFGPKYCITVAVNIHFFVIVNNVQFLCSSFCSVNRIQFYLVCCSSTGAYSIRLMTRVLWRSLMSFSEKFFFETTSKINIAGHSVACNFMCLWTVIIVSKTTRRSLSSSTSGRVWFSCTNAEDWSCAHTTSVYDLLRLSSYLFLVFPLQRLLNHQHILSSDSHRFHSYQDHKWLCWTVVLHLQCPMGLFGWWMLKLRPEVRCWWRFFSQIENLGTNW